MRGWAVCRDAWPFARVDLRRQGTLRSNVVTPRTPMRITKVLFIIALGSPSAAWAADSAEPAPEYSFQAEAPVRLRGGPVDVRWQTVPFNRTYAQLSPSERAAFKSLYVDMPEADEPPFPVGGLKQIYEPIGQGQAALGANGTLVMEVVVGADGEPQEVHVLRSPNKQVTQFVAGVAMVTKFKPAVCSGKPCRAGFPIRVQFKME